MKKGAAVLVALAALVASAALAGSGAAKPNAQYTIGFIPPVIANPAIKALNDGIALKAKALGMNFETIGGQYSPQAQIVAMNAAIQKKVNMILIWPLDPKGIQPSFQRQRRPASRSSRSGRPASRTSTPTSSTTIRQAIEQIAKDAAAELKKEGKPCAVGIIQGIPVVNILNARNVGYGGRCAKAAGCTILEQQVNQQDNNSGALPIVQAWKTKYGSKMTAILAYNDPSAEGAIAARSGRLPAARHRHERRPGRARGGQERLDVRHRRGAERGARRGDGAGRRDLPGRTRPIPKDDLVQLRDHHEGQRGLLQAVGRPARRRAR